jgi:hypothetical protein
MASSDVDIDAGLDRAEDGPETDILSVLAVRGDRLALLRRSVETAQRRDAFAPDGHLARSLAAALTGASLAGGRPG